MPDQLLAAEIPIFIAAQHQKSHHVLPKGVLNGNVDGFTVSHNLVHDNDNIGIDFIGFEGNGPATLDQARNGRCFGNRVYNISSAANPGPMIRVSR